MATTGIKYATSVIWWDSDWPASYDSSYGVRNIVDTNYTNYSYIAAYSGKQGHIAFNGFDFSELPSNAIITGYTFQIRAAPNTANPVGGTYLYAQLGLDAVVTKFSSAGSRPNNGTYTAVGAEIKFIDKVKVGNTNVVTHTHTSDSNDSAGITWLNQNIGKIKNGNIGLFLDCHVIRLYYVTLELEYVIPSVVSVGVTPSGSGSVTGGGSYANGSTATLTATPSAGYKFKQWQDGNTSNPRTITVSGDATYTATFALNSYTVSTAVSPSGSGTVTGAGTYNHGSTATLTATPATGYEFVKWSDNNTSNPRSVTVTTAATYTAVFQLKTYTIYLKDDEGNSLGSVTATHGSSPVITTTPTKQPSGGATYTFREWNTQRDGSGTSYPLNGLPAATGSTTYFAQFDAAYSEPDIASVTVAPNPATGGQGIVITVTFST